MNKTDKLLLDLLSCALVGKKCTADFSDVNDADLNLLYDECKAQSVEPLIYETIVSDFPDVKLSADWEDYYNGAVARNVAVCAYHEYVDTTLKKAGIGYCILKGMSSAHYYPKPYLRCMGDVDFLVGEKDLERAEELFKADGYTVLSATSVCHITLEKDNSSIELHHEPAGIPLGKPGDMIREYLSDVLEKAKNSDDGLGVCVIPDRFHHGIIVFLHLLHHLICEGIGLRHLCDWAVFLNSYEEESFAEEFEEKLSEVGLWRSIQLISQTCVKYLGCEKRLWMGSFDESFCDELIEDIVSAGNFGRKDGVRSGAGYFISNRGSDGVGGNWFVQGFRTLNDRVYLYMPFIKKHKILLPVGWIAQAFRLLKRILTGKRGKLYLVDSIKQSDERRKLYGKMNLYK